MTELPRPRHPKPAAAQPPGEGGAEEPEVDGLTDHQVAGRAPRSLAEQRRPRPARVADRPHAAGVPVLDAIDRPPVVGRPRHAVKFDAERPTGVGERRAERDVEDLAAHPPHVPAHDAGGGSGDRTSEHLAPLRQVEREVRLKQWEALLGRYVSTANELTVDEFDLLMKGKDEETVGG